MDLKHYKEFQGTRSFRFTRPMAVLIICLQHTHGIHFSKSLDLVFVVEISDRNICLVPVWLIITSLFSLFARRALRFCFLLVCVYAVSIN